MKDRDFPGKVVVSPQPSLLLSLDEGSQVWLGFPVSSSSWFSRYLWHSQRKAETPVAPAEQEGMSAAAWDVMASVERRVRAEEKQEQGKPEPDPEQSSEREEPSGIIERFERLIERVFRRQPLPPEK